MKHWRLHYRYLNEMTRCHAYYGREMLSLLWYRSHIRLAAIQTGANIEKVERLNRLSREALKKEYAAMKSIILDTHRRDLSRF